MLSDLEAAFASGCPDETELVVEKDLNTGQASWHVRGRADPVLERCRLEGEGGADVVMPQAFRPGHEKSAPHVGRREGGMSIIFRRSPRISRICAEGPQRRRPQRAPRDRDVGLAQTREFRAEVRQFMSMPRVLLPSMVTSCRSRSTIWTPGRPT
ncbi:unnamed protein product [Prorocentrum cordatum]|uniref:Uncharacterized protein n=1 Tax=Prorocentrum cordatum TaxID=2364126 RepID=A0ABN9PAV8_9DINO|nr:unnamed protein product [Polarella glacialis]